METKLTRGGIAYDLNNSPFKEEVEYDNGLKIEYRFSSNNYKIKFLSKLGENRRMINHSLSKRFGFTIKADVVADLRLYTQIEKRGFLLFINGAKVSWLEKLQVYGNVVTILKD